MNVLNEFTKKKNQIWNYQAPTRTHCGPIFKLGDKKGFFHYIDEREPFWSKIRPQSLVYLQKETESVIVKDSGGYYKLNR